MFTFTNYGMMITGTLLLLSVIIILFFRVHIKRREYISRKIGFIYFIMGDVFILLSVILFVLIRREINKQFFLFTSIAEGASEPFRLIMIALFLTGLTLTIIGAFYLFYSTRIIHSNKITRET